MSHQLTTTIRPFGARRAALGAVLGFGLALGGTFVAAPPGAAAAHGGGTHLECGAVVTTDIRLANDLVDCTEYGIVVGAPGITIDLGGHTIDGVGLYVTRSGVFNDGHDGLTVKNGRIQEFSLGIDTYQANGGTFRKLFVTATIDGINLHDSDGSTIERSAFRANRTGIHVFESDQVRVSRNVFVGNETDGATDTRTVGNHYDRNLFADNTFDGLALDQSQDAVVELNTFLRNGIDGFNAGGGSDRVVVRANVAAHNDEHGVMVDGAAATFAGNVAKFNGGVGILAMEDAIDAGRNRAWRNAGGNCTNLSC